MWSYIMVDVQDNAKLLEQTVKHQRLKAGAKWLLIGLSVGLTVGFIIGAIAIKINITVGA
jgi:hypothetical protein